MYRSQEGRLVLNDLSMSMAATSSESFESDLTAARDHVSTWIIPDSPYQAELERREDNGLGTSTGVREIVEKLGISVQAACLALGIPTPRPTTIGGKSLVARCLVANALNGPFVLRLDVASCVSITDSDVEEVINKTFKNC